LDSREIVMMISLTGSLTVKQQWGMIHLRPKDRSLLCPKPRLYKDEVRQRQLISIEDAKKMVRATIDTRDRAILLLLLKTGIRRNELVTLDLEDVNLRDQSLMLKPTGKRSNRIVFFDEEATRILARWLAARETRYKQKGERSLFI
jgi:integrase/recombinase XerD